MLKLRMQAVFSGGGSGSDDVKDQVDTALEALVSMGSHWSACSCEPVQQQ